MEKPSRRYFIDSNVFLYAAGEESSFKKRSLDALAELAEQGAIAVTNCLVLEEIHYVYYRQTRKPKECLALLQDIRSGLGEIISITPEIVTLACELFAKIPSPVSSVKDYYHAASMQYYGIDSIISFDRDYDRFPIVKRIEPGKP